MDFSETKQADRDASEYHLNHCHTDRGGSKTHPIHWPADSCQHTVLTISLQHVYFLINLKNDRISAILWIVFVSPNVVDKALKMASFNYITKESLP